MQQRWIARLTVALLLGAGVPVLAQDLPGADELDAPVEEDLPPEEAEAPESPAADTDAPPARVAPARSSMGDTTGIQTETSAATAATAEPLPPETDERLVAPGLNLDGTVGLQHLAAAWGGGPNTYRVALLTEFFSGRNAVRFNDVDTRFIGNLLIEASPIRYFSANLRIQTRSNVNTFGRPEAMLSQGDLLLGLKGSFPIADGLWLGGDLTFDAPADFGTTGLGLSGTSIRPRGIFSFDGRQMGAGFPLQGHLNLGYRADNTPNLIPEGVEVTRVERFAYDLSAYDMFEIGLGFAVDLPYVSPFLAWNLGIPVAPEGGVCDNPALPCVSDVGFGSFPNLLSFGVKAEPIDHLGLHAGLDLGLTSEDAAGLPVTAPYTVVLGASWTIDPRPKIEYVEKVVEDPNPVVPEGIVLGTVVDEVTKEPIDGVIVRYDTGETPQATADGGRFRSYGFAPSTPLKLTLEHPDYQARTVDYLVEGEAGEQELALELTPIPKQAVIGGRVVDEAGNPVASPTVKISGEEEYEPLANSDGTFEENVTAGKYTVAVSAPGYMTAGKDVEVEVDGKVDVAITLKPAPTESLVSLREDKIEIQQKIFFETGKATILPRSFGVLDQVASVLIGNPQVKRLQIEGHTDDVGGDDFNMELSQSRAESVREFLVNAGVSPDRLIAKGFGETRPVLPNTSKRNQSFNRRVEFNIIRE